MIFKRKPVEIASAANQILERMMPLLTPLGVALGIVFTSFFLTLRPLVPWFFGIMTLSGALKLRVRELGMAVTNPLLIILFFLSAHVLMPLGVMLASGLVFNGDADIVSGYVLLYAVPTAVTGFIWTTVFRGDPALSLALILLDTILAPIVVPATVRIFLGTKAALDMTGIAVSLIFMVVVPTIIGVALNEVSRGAVPRAAGPYLGPFSKICIVLVISANAAAVAPQIHPENPIVWLIGAMCIIFSASGFVCGKIIGLLGRESRARQATLIFSVGLHNTSAAMTLGIEFFPGPAALPAVLGVIFQQTIAALMGRGLLKKEEEEKPET
ncbi:MAG: bile acid:sodium symporter family protein [Treponema sp.]|jgi:predicted Na+-dependent transporter|nr:bile acid:sodium symporter family protein [Treponema sp.]